VEFPSGRNAQSTYAPICIVSRRAAREDSCLEVLSVKPKLTRSPVLLFVGMLIGAGIVAAISVADEYRPMTGYAFWSKADGNLKFAYVTGYSDAEQMYRLILDKGANHSAPMPERSGLKM
jgi:hypothetical protein